MLVANLRRHRKPLVVLVLGAWLFALFVGVANACPPSMAHPAGMVMPADSHDGAPQTPFANCLQFCADDTPVFSKLQLVQGQPTGKALLVATATAFHAAPTATAVDITHPAHPPSGVPVLFRSLRFAL
jgi:hypothetical protein